MKAIVAPRQTVVHTPAPVAPAAISAERYIAPAWLERELGALFPNAWLVACLEADLPEPGSYQVFEIGRESILVTRDEAGTVRAFYNVCQHRGARVMVNAGGWVSRFVCPYHGWCYDYEGRLEHVPDRERFANGVDCAARSLKPVQASTWAGLVWICMDLEAPPLATFLGPLTAMIDPYDLASMTLIADQTVSLDCNWKAVYDNFGELYHVDHIHPQHERMFNCPEATVHLYDQGHTGVVIDGHTVNPRLPIPEEPNAYLSHQLALFGGDPARYRGRVLDVRADIQRLRRANGAALGWDYSRLSDARLSDIEQYNFFPNAMLTVQPDDALLMRARPHPTDPNRCYWDKLTFHRFADSEVAARAGVPFAGKDPLGSPPSERPAHDSFTQEDIIAGRKTMTPTIDQDIHLIRDVQAGMHSRGFSTQLLCDDEVRVQHYHDWLDYRLGMRR